MTCSEKVRLTRDYDAATTKFSEAVNQLQLRLGTSTRAEYESLQRISVESRAKSEEARLSLERHMADHNC
jgi:hypothetical protein